MLRAGTDDSGMVTAEAAVVLPVLVFALAGALAAVAIVTAQLRCTDAAREGARAAARGETDAAVREIALSAAPAGSSISIRRGEETATVEVTASVPLISGLGPAMTVSAEAVAALEPGVGSLAASDGVLTTTNVWLARGPPGMTRGLAFLPITTVGVLRGQLPRRSELNRPRRTVSGRASCPNPAPRRRRSTSLPTVGGPRSIRAIRGRHPGWRRDRASGRRSHRGLPWCRRPSDDGSASLWVLALSGVVLLAAAASVLAGVAIISRHQAGTAADLAALAAASKALSGSEVACGLAEEITVANGAVLQSCSLGADGVVEIAAVVEVQFGPLGVGVAQAQARAGPAQANGPTHGDPFP